MPNKIFTLDLYFRNIKLGRVVSDKMRSGIESRGELRRQLGDIAVN